METSMSNVLVTGVRGKTGRQVAAALLRRKEAAVRGAARNLDGRAIPGVALSRFDWQDAASWPAALTGIDALYLIRPKTADPAGTIQELLRSAESLRRVVLLSEIDCENRPKDTDERKAEAAVMSSSVSWTILRPNWFMQNFTEPSFYLEAVRDAGKLEVPTGGQATSFVDTRDIGEVAAAALLDDRHGERCYTLTGPHAITWGEAARLMGDAAGHPVRYFDPPLEEHLGSLSGKGTAQSMVDYLGRIYGCIREGRTSIVSSDVERVTGHPPRSFAAFVEESKKAWRRAH
jgi:uncharacterized protein YbjT (DUF2867 family)